MLRNNAFAVCDWASLYVYLFIVGRQKGFKGILVGIRFVGGVYNMKRS